MYAIVAYTAGALFRFLDQGLQVAEKKRLTKDVLCANLDAGDYCWDEGWCDFMTLYKLEEQKVMKLM